MVDSSDTLAHAKRSKCEHDVTADNISAVVEAFLACHDGPSRLSLTNEEWYGTRPNAAQTLFRFISFKELKTYVLAFFDDVKFETPKISMKEGKIQMVKP